MAKKNKYDAGARFREILSVLYKHGFGAFLGRAGLFRFFSGLKRVLLTQRSDEEAQKYPPEVRLRMALEELGPIFIKFGQILSTRADLIAPEYIAQLRILREQATPFDRENAHLIVEKEFKKPIGELFKSFEKEPIAAASIAQVHRAYLPNGEKVAVKIKRPGIEQVITSDIRILEKLADLLVKYVEESKVIDPPALVTEFRRTILEEVDFTLEASSAERFATNFANNPNVHVPKVFWDYTTVNIITLEWVEGSDLFDVDHLPENLEIREKVAQNGLECFLQQILQDGFFHADPHTGNALAMDDGRVALIDFGMVGRIDSEMMEQIAQIFLALNEHEYNKLIAVFVRMGVIHQNVDMRQFKHDLKEVAEPLYGRDLRHIDLVMVYNAIMDLSMQHHCKIPRELLMLFKSILAVEAVSKDLGTDTTLLETARPYARRLIQRKFEPHKAAQTMRDDVMEIMDSVKVYPLHIEKILYKMQSGQFRLEHRILDLEEFSADFTRIGNRIVLTMIICASVLGGAQIMSSNLDVDLAGLTSFSISTVLGLMGYGFATLLGLWVVYGVVKSNKI